MVQSKWDLVRTDTFLELYQTKDDFQKQKIKQIIDQLAQEDNLLRIGQKKKPLNFWAADITRGDRLAYSVEDGKIYLLKVCSHKEVYGRD